MVAVKALRRWLVVAALLRCLSGKVAAQQPICRKPGSPFQCPILTHRWLQYILAFLTLTLSRQQYLTSNQTKVCPYDSHGLWRVVCWGAVCSQPVPCPVTDLYGRTFATWTLTTSVLCLICAKNPCIPSIYGARGTEDMCRTQLLCKLPNRLCGGHGACHAAAD